MLYVRVGCCCIAFVGWHTVSLTVCSVSVCVVLDIRFVSSRLVPDTRAVFVPWALRIAKCVWGCGVPCSLASCLGCHCSYPLPRAPRSLSQHCFQEVGAAVSEVSSSDEKLVATLFEDSDGEQACEAEEDPDFSEEGEDEEVAGAASLAKVAGAASSAVAALLCDMCKRSSEDMWVGACSL